MTFVHDDRLIDTLQQRRLSIHKDGIKQMVQKSENGITQAIEDEQDIAEVCDKWCCCRTRLQKAQ